MKTRRGTKERLQPQVLKHTALLNGFSSQKLLHVFFCCCSLTIFFVKLNFFHRLWTKNCLWNCKQLVDFLNKKSVKSKCWKRWVIQNRPFETWLPSKMTEHNLYSKVNLTILFSISYWKLLIFFFGVFFWPLLILFWIFSCKRQNLSYHFDDRTQLVLSCSKVNLTVFTPFYHKKLLIF